MFGHWFQLSRQCFAEMVPWSRAQWPNVAKYRLVLNQPQMLAACSEER